MFSTKKARINVIIWKWTTGTSFGTSYNVQNLSCLFRSTGLAMTTLRMSIHQLTILVGPHWGTICLEWIFLVKINSFRIRQKCFHFSQNFSKWFKRQSSFLFKNGKREKKSINFFTSILFWQSVNHYQTIKVTFFKSRPTKSWRREREIVTGKEGEEKEKERERVRGDRC